ncbi:tetratricopeptide repeat protein [Psychroserpens sp. AS72]|uniref:tetratricopeptide repeat protein n=1 Tax=Psychroserpens sp. AS72 TaxID=3135775 RepID=UPI00317058B2
MPEPITIVSSAVFLLGEIGKSILSRKGDKFFCDSLKTIHNKFVFSIDEPINHDILKALRRAQLKSTMLACKQVYLTKYKIWDNFISNAPQNLKEVLYYLKQELKKVDNNGFIDIGDLSNEDLIYVLETEIIDINDRFIDLQNNQKNFMINELKSAKLNWVEESLRDVILYGWKTDDRRVDWFELMRSFFVEELKVNKRVSNAVFMNFLIDFKSDFNEIESTFKTFQEHLEGLKFENDNIKNEFIEIAHNLENLKIDLSKVIKDENKKIKKYLTNKIQLEGAKIRTRIQKNESEIKKSIDEGFKTGNEISTNINMTVLEIKEILENSKVNIEKLEIYLKQLPLSEGVENIQNKIDDWFFNKNISYDEKRFLSTIISVMLNELELINEKINRLKSLGNFELSNVLERIQVHFKKSDADKIQREYYSRYKKLNEENIFILREAISATSSLLAFKETFSLYEELVKIEPSAINHSQLGYYSYKLGRVDDSIRYFKESIELYEKNLLKSKEEQIFGKAYTLNQLGNIYVEKNDKDNAEIYLSEAIKLFESLSSDKPNVNFYKYHYAKSLNSFSLLYFKFNNNDKFFEINTKALKVYETLIVDENIEEVLYDSAIILNNIGVNYASRGETILALQNFDKSLRYYGKIKEKNNIDFLLGKSEALKNISNVFRNNNLHFLGYDNFMQSYNIIFDLAEKAPDKSAIYYAELLILGVNDYQWSADKLAFAKTILNKEPDSYKKIELLKFVEKIESKNEGFVLTSFVYNFE